MATTVTNVPAPPAPPPLLRVRDLGVSFEMAGGSRLRAVDGVSLTVHGGQTLALVGESGCGKSVTALSLLRLVPEPPGRIDRGRIEFDGEDLTALPESKMLRIRGGEIAMIFQEPMTSLNPVLTVGEQIIEAVRLHQRLRGRAARDVALEVLRSVGIVRAARCMKSYPHELSGGMCQRAMIATALACRPRLLLADEPTTALDVTIQAQILELLGDIQRRTGMSLVLITHDLGVVAQIADVVCVMYAGRVVEYASVFHLFDRPYHPYTRGLFNSIPRLDEHRHRLRTVDQIVSEESEFRKLPGYQYGIVPWWPRMPSPIELAPGDGPMADYSLFEVEPSHWVGCWRTEYVANHPLRPPDLDFRRSQGAPVTTGAP